MPKAHINLSTLFFLLQSLVTFFFNSYEFLRIRLNESVKVVLEVVNFKMSIFFPPENETEQSKELIYRRISTLIRSKLKRSLKKTFFFEKKI